MPFSSQLNIIITTSFLCLFISLIILLSVSICAVVDLPFPKTILIHTENRIHLREKTVKDNFVIYLCCYWDESNSSLIEWICEVSFLWDNLYNARFYKFGRSDICKGVVAYM